MCTIELQLDDDLAGLLRAEGRPLEECVSEMLVLELYRRGELSSGRAAELLKMPRFEFIRHASSLGIPAINMNREQWESQRAASESL